MEHSAKRPAKQRQPVPPERQRLRPKRPHSEEVRVPRELREPPESPEVRGPQRAPEPQTPERAREPAEEPELVAEAPRPHQGQTSPLPPEPSSRPVRARAPVKSPRIRHRLPHCRLTATGRNPQSHSMSENHPETDP